MSNAFKPLLSQLVDGATLSEAEAETFFSACLRGEPTSAQVAAAVTAMRMRGETVGEITACARVIRRSAKVLAHDFAVIDTCGTGGDGLHTYNISTAAALVAAGGGLKVANICFLYAPAHHGALRHVMPVRAELGFRTIFNLLGPLSNPAGAKRQILGVYDPRLVEPLARVLGALGAERAWVVHGSGLDEMTTTGPTQIAEWRNDQIRLFTVTPQALGLPVVEIAALRGGDAHDNALALHDLLEGAPGPYRDIVRLNAAAAFLVADRVETLQEGLQLAAQAIDDGRARAALDALVLISNGAPL